MAIAASATLATALAVQAAGREHLPPPVVHDLDKILFRGKSCLDPVDPLPAVEQAAAAARRVANGMGGYGGVTVTRDLAYVRFHASYDQVEAFEQVRRQSPHPKRLRLARTDGTIEELREHELHLQQLAAAEAAISRVEISEQCNLVLVTAVFPDRRLAQRIFDVAGSWAHLMAEAGPTLVEVVEWKSVRVGEDGRTITLTLDDPCWAEVMRVEAKELPERVVIEPLIRHDFLGSGTRGCGSHPDIEASVVLQTPLGGRRIEQSPRIGYLHPGEMPFEQIDFGTDSP